MERPAAGARPLSRGHRRRAWHDRGVGRAADAGRRPEQSLRVVGPGRECDRPGLAHFRTCHPRRDRSLLRAEPRVSISRAAPPAAGCPGDLGRDPSRGRGLALDGLDGTGATGHLDRGGRRARRRQHVATVPDRLGLARDALLARFDRGRHDPARRRDVGREHRRDAIRRRRRRVGHDFRCAVARRSSSFPGRSRRAAWSGSASGRTSVSVSAARSPRRTAWRPWQSCLSA